MFTITVLQELKKELDEGYKQLQLMGEFAEELQASEAVQETNHLEKLLNDYKNSAKAERERLRKLEADSAERDKQLAEALTRIGQYENGTYGLREAVQVCCWRFVFDLISFGALRIECKFQNKNVRNRSHCFAPMLSGDCYADDNTSYLGNQRSEEAAWDT